MDRPGRILTALLLALALSLPGCRERKVIAYESTILLKTNREACPNNAPQFPLTSRGLYPYRLQTNLDYALKATPFRALCLENENLKITVLPELGGHVYSVIDKKTGHDLFFANPELKKSLIGLTGAWCAFGLEFNGPVRGHTPSSLRPVNARIVRNPDRSASVVLNDREYNGGLDWTAEIVLRPGTARLEVRMRLQNATDFPRPLYFWCNAAVPANDNTEIILPSAKASTHGSPWIKSWPVDEEGDLSWYKNQTRYMYSRFTRDDLEPFMGYYDHAKDFGAFHWADRDLLPYRKFWSWGQAPPGKNWCKRLSDSGGDYIELQAGLFKDQETLAWLAPREGVSFTEYWMPVRGIGGFKAGSPDAALSLEIKALASGDDSVHVGVNAFAELPGGMVEILANGRILASKRTLLSPDRGVLSFGWRLPRASGPYTARIRGLDSTVILEYTDGQYRNVTVDTVGSYPEAAMDSASSEGWLQKGVEAELLYKKAGAADAYFKGLARFPHSFLLAKAAGRVRLERGETDSAIALFRKAVYFFRAQHDPELDYLQGLAFARKGRTKLAESFFRQALRMNCFSAACRYQLGLLAAQDKNYAQALANFREAAYFSPEDPEPLSMEALVLRLSGKKLLAQEAAEKVVKKFPAAFLASALIQGPRAVSFESAVLPRPEFGQWQALLEPVIAAGGLADAEAVLLREPALLSDPLARYLLNWLRRSLDKTDTLAGMRTDVAGVFPFTPLDETVLRDAIQHNPGDAAARHLLGCYYVFMGRLNEARAELEAAVRLKTAGAWPHAVLATVYELLNEPASRAISELKAALLCEPGLQEAALPLNDLLIRNGEPCAERRALLLSVKTAAGPCVSEALEEAIIIGDMEAGRFADAKEGLLRREYHTWEGGSGMRAVWWNNSLLWARDLLKAGKPVEALARADSSMIFPANLNAEESNYGMEGFQTNFIRGKTLEALGKRAEAMEAYRAVVEWKPFAAANQTQRDVSYHDAYAFLALKKLGRTAEADAMSKRFRAALAEPGLPALTRAHLRAVLGEKAGAPIGKDMPVKEHESGLTRLLLSEIVKGNLP
ncbi:MAG: DUF5107 domain-containing protein [Fibrobacterota bacterium]